jgi:hypothetical protein
MKRLTTAALTAGLVTLVAAAPAWADHSWGGYHWARTSNPFTVKLGDNLSSSWKTHLATASSDWSRSTVLDTTVVAGQATGRCKPTAGRVEVCNGSYGQNGWLGLASIWLASGSKHITKGAVKLNDTYFSMPRYNLTTEKQHVVCQEVGHTFGLDHQDESGASLNTCMDYYRNTSNSDTRSTHPNSHDYDELTAIYTHLDATNTARVSTAATNTAPAPWFGAAPPTSRSVYVRHLANGGRVVTFVIWAQPLLIR